MHSQVFPHAHFGRWPQRMSRFVWQFVCLLVEASASSGSLHVELHFPCLNWSGHECVALGFHCIQSYTKSFVAIYVLMLKSIIAYLHGPVS